MESTETAPLDQAFRDVMASTSTPVAVVTTLSDGLPHGTTVNAFASLSMDPPMVLVSLDRRSDLLAEIRVTRRFGVNVLVVHQSALAMNFARKGGTAKFTEVEWVREDGVPRLPEAGAFLSCEVTDLVPGGDHVVVLGAVRVATRLTGEPLTYHQRTFGTHVALPQTGGPTATAPAREEKTVPSTVPEESAPARPAADEVVAAVREHAALIDEHAALNDREGRIAEPVVDLLHATGALGVFTPRSLGGAEMRPRQAMDLFAALASADPAAGWVTFALGFGTGITGAFLPRDAAEALFATPRFGVAGQGTRAGKAVPERGGYRLSGSWSFASGVKHATHAIAAGQDTETGEVRCFILPVDEVTFVDDWDVLGLRATGSISYVLQDAFVPTRQSFPATSRRPVSGGSVYRIGIGNFAALNHGGWALGVGRRLLDEYARGLRAKEAKGGPAMSDAVAEHYAEAETKHRAAKALLYEVWEEIEGVLDAGDDVPLRLETVSRVALCNATWRTAEIAEFVYTGSGTAALRDGVVQRLFRDVHAGTQHISSSPLILQSAGRELAGLADGKRWVHHMLK